MTLLATIRPREPRPPRRSRRCCGPTEYDKTCLKSLLKHSCWSAVILGFIMLALGIILRSSLITKTSSTVTSSGLLFILIGIFIICMGPLAAIYDVVSTRKRRIRGQSADSETGSASPRPSDATDPPSYVQVMTGQKTPSATYSMRFYPQVLSVNGLPDNRPPPPSYEEIIEEQGVEEPEPKSETRRMTSP